MSIPVLTFFNNKGGVGKTSLVYHLAWMLSERMNILAADFDPQANLTSAFLDEDRIEEIWNAKQTIVAAIDPLHGGTGDIAEAHIEPIGDRLGLIAGDLNLAKYEDALSEVWPKCLRSDPRAFRVTSSFWRILQNAGNRKNADLIVIDVGPNLGAINRTALISSDYVVVPMTPDLFSLQGLRNLGPTTRTWRKEWSECLEKKPNIELPLPAGSMHVLGYIIMQHRERLNRPTKAYRNFSDQFPAAYRECVLDRSESEKSISPDADEYCLGFVKHYSSLMPMAQEARKPIFALNASDGAIGAHSITASEARSLFKALADKLLEKMNIVINDND